MSRGPARSRGRAVSPGLALAGVSSWTSGRLAALRRPMPADRLGLELSRLDAQLGGGARTRTLREAVLQYMKREGGGLEFAIGLVLLASYRARKLSGAEDDDQRIGLCENVIQGLLAMRCRDAETMKTYIAVGPCLNVAEILELPPGLVGLAAESGDEDDLAAAGRLLGIPVVLGLPNLDELAREGDVIRLDGTTGVLEVVACSGENPAREGCVR